MSAASPDYPRVFVLPGRDKRAARGHPWVYANEVRMDAEAKALAPGAIVLLLRTDGKPLGVGTFNPHALIAFRFLSRDPAVCVDEAFFAGRLGRALALREQLFDAPYYRLAHAEADGLPGLVVDRFGPVLSVQAGTAGMDGCLPQVLAALDTLLAPAAVVLRNDGRGRALEGLAAEVRVVKGRLDGPVEVKEGGLTFLADLGEGQKTGWFFDQRDNRARVARLAKGGRMLDVYCYAGGFAVSAAAAGATEVLAVDSSEKALELAALSARVNGVAGRCAWRRADAFEEMARLDAAGERFEVVAVDPPAFVKSRKDLASGLKGYGKLARLAARLVAPGGFLFMASCSHNVEPAPFAETVAEGVYKAGREGRVLSATGAAADHPVHPQLPESAYLKALILQLD
ncbi:class I SAM-dependent rRNA methyltransferase [Shumkonia mesophila]|uniref:class I SAM-dependent rRNA methyltransferase n=1 Tax=Shumkonia mesophila TaxID=2838854 RepID=UPI002934523F|nr:class I SAM-dependent rRNA methyltransferase [Shumkonia mesophila]